MVTDLHRKELICRVELYLMAHLVPEMLSSTQDGTAGRTQIAC